MYTSIETLYTLFLQSADIVIDSRKIKSDSLFFALKGTQTDGNKFAEAALQQGALAAIVDNPDLKDIDGCYWVEDVLTSLQDLARHHRKTFSFPVIGLTGSNGKTTSKELLHAVLSSTFSGSATQGNLNNHIGVPLTILSVRQNPEYLIVEMGANHQGEIAFLSGISNPDYGFITNIGKAHLEGFGGEEGVRKGKTELYRHLLATGGHLFVNGEDLKQTSSVPDSFPKEKIYYIYPSPHLVTNHNATFLSFVYNDQTYESQLVGDYNISNIVTAIEIGKYFGVKEADAIEAVTQYSPSNNRSQLKAWKGMSLIMDAYNANPSSMRASVQNFGHHPAGQKVLILGDMFELGEWSQKEHEDMVKFCETFNWEKVILIGQEFKKCSGNQTNYEFYNSPEEARPSFRKLENSGAVVLLKGSRGISLEKLLES
ncbi:MAG: UDP-N-acetylmuramoyl-tripeptide--D-alanyl-D-alanine ligase [Saprospiraceae bacterium]|nr:UDP-N-acetylmuramoyl-tripeptide--D-alanyl-D-alanine ligase [Saprospiraceae bacterium]